MDRAIADGRAVTPEVAVQSVRRFCGDRNLEVVVELYREHALRFGRQSACFDLRVTGGPWEGRYVVRADDGTVQSWLHSTEEDEPEGARPAVSLAAATQQAQKFAREHVPGFDRRAWRIPRGYPLDEDGVYEFAWTEVLNSYGTLACWSLELTVDKATGQVTSFAAPQDQFSGPRVPRISRERAIALASRVTAYRLPFQDITLEVTEDAYGVQGLVWSLMQYPDPANPDLHAQVLVDALTGQASGPVAPLSAPPASGAGDRSPGSSPSRITPELRPRGGKSIQSAPLQRKNGTLWARAELLRGLGALVTTQPDHLLVRAGKVLANEKSLGAERRGDGWWVPVRKGCAVLGWKFQWDAKSQQVVVDGDPI